MKPFINIYHTSLNKWNEELCGDQIRVLRTAEKTRVVLSDGLGSGVKANILASLTAEIVINMLREEASLQDAVETVVHTLPVCKERLIAYATCTVIEIDHRNLDFHIYNFDGPPPLLFRKGKYLPRNYHEERMYGRRIMMTQGSLQYGDLMVSFSDGVLYAGSSQTMNYAWDTEAIIKFIENIFQYHPTSAYTFVHMTMNRTRELYQDRPLDDASMVGLYVRPSQPVMVFTGPPIDVHDDCQVVHRLMSFEGTRIVCGGTTANIVAECTKQKIQTDMSTMREDSPPIGVLQGIDLVTEGILTLNKASELIEQCGGDIHKLPDERTGGVLLALALLNADEVTFMVGQAINSYYQNPHLPKSMSIRRNLVEKICAQLQKLDKPVSIEYY